MGLCGSCESDSAQADEAAKNSPKEKRDVEESVDDEIARASTTTKTSQQNHPPNLRKTPTIEGEAQESTNWDIKGVEEDGGDDPFAGIDDFPTESSIDDPNEARDIVHEGDIKLQLEKFQADEDEGEYLDFRMEDDSPKIEELASSGAYTHFAFNLAEIDTVKKEILRHSETLRLCYSIPSPKSHNRAASARTTAFSAPPPSSGLDWIPGDLDDDTPTDINDNTQHTSSNNDRTDNSTGISPDIDTNTNIEATARGFDPPRKLRSRSASALTERERATELAQKFSEVLTAKAIHLKRAYDRNEMDEASYKRVSNRLEDAFNLLKAQTKLPLKMSVSHVKRASASVVQQHREELKARQRRN